MSSASPPVGPYRPVVRAGEFLICSGQLGLLHGALVTGGVDGQLRRAVANLSALLESEGSTLADVVKTTVFLADIADYAEMNAAYVECFTGERPARSAVAVSGLPLGAVVELEAWALSPPV